MDNSLSKAPISKLEKALFDALILSNISFGSQHKFSCNIREVWHYVLDYIEKNNIGDGDK